MKINNKLFIRILICYAAVPLVGFLLYCLGSYSFNADIIYSVTQFAIFCISIMYIRQAANNIKIFFLLLLVPMTLNLTICILTIGLSKGLIEWAKIIKNFYFIFFFSYVIYRFYMLDSKMKHLYRIIVILGVIVSCINLLYAFDSYLNVFGIYNKVIDYIYYTKEEYATYLVSYVGIRRPMGYFYDIHSQYYLPMGALFLLMITRIKFKYSKLCFFLMMVAVLISSVRIAYVMFLVLTPISLLLVDLKQKVRIAIIITAIAAVLLYFFNSITIRILNQLRGVSGASQKLILEHLRTIPFLLWEQNPITFLFGGTPGMRADLYSEVYLWALLFYIGLIGLLFYLAPFVMVFRIKKYKLALFYCAMLTLSLLHYKVYNTGINTIVSALPFVFFYDFISKITISNAKIYSR